MMSVPGLPHRSLGVALTLAAVFLGLGTAYQFFVTFECSDTGLNEGCRFVRSLFARTLAVVAVAALLIRARPGLFGRLAADAETNPLAPRMAIVFAAGTALMALPLAWDASDARAFFLAALVPWLAGAALAGVSGLLWLAPPPAWRRLRDEAGPALVPVLVLALIVPDVADVALPLWDINTMTMATFVAVAVTLIATGQPAWADPQAMTIGLDTFAVHIARQCSGVEGLALVVVFSVVYAMLFRATLRQGPFWLVVVPLALVASWTFNVLRIAALITLGEHVSPTLAVDGFHSYAGWLFFTILVTGILAIVQSVPGLWRTEGETVSAVPLPPLRSDPVAARIVPFVAFMAASIAASALFLPADLGYPIKAAAMALALWLFRAALAELAERPDAVAVLSGIAVGLAWALTEPPAGPASAALSAALGTLSALLLAGWILCRVVGTVVLVPVVEELFFRGYVLQRLDRGGIAWRVAAIMLSSAVFAALHGRVEAAFLAGLVFAAVMLRRGKVIDAVASHIAANAVVAAFAATSGDWTRL